MTTSNQTANHIILHQDNQRVFRIRFGDECWVLEQLDRKLRVVLPDWSFDDHVRHSWDFISHAELMRHLKWIGIFQIDQVYRIAEVFWHDWDDFKKQLKRKDIKFLISEIHELSLHVEARKDLLHGPVPREFKLLERKHFPRVPISVLDFPSPPTSTATKTGHALRAGISDFVEEMDNIIKTDRDGGESL